MFGGVGEKGEEGVERYVEEGVNEKRECVCVGRDGRI